MPREDSDRRSAGYEVYRKLRERIITLQIRPGEPLAENRIAELMGVSRTPVREAFGKLEQEGLVQLVPDKGAFVTEIDPRIINEIFIARQALEGMAARLAALNISDSELAELDGKFREAESAWASSGWGSAVEEIHVAAIRISRVNLISKIVATFSAQTERFRNIGEKGDKLYDEREPIVFSEHKRIFEAIKRRDPDSAEQAMREHLQNSKNAVIQLWLNNYLSSSFSVLK